MILSGFFLPDPLAPFLEEESKQPLGREGCPPRTNKESNMKLSFSTVGCPRWDWQSIVATARDLGYDGVEVRGVGKDISVPSVPEFGEARLGATLDNLAKMNLSVPCLASDCCLHVPQRREETVREVRAYVDLAQRMGAPFVRVMGAAAVPEPTGGVDERFVGEVAAELGEYALPRGVTLLIETNGVWADSQKLAKLLSDIGSPAVGALWDINHPFIYFDEPPEATYANLKPHIRHVHVKDALNEEGKVRYAMMGYGRLPIKRMVGLMKEGGYEGFYSLEWVKRWDMSLEEPGIVFAHYVNYMRALGA